MSARPIWLRLPSFALLLAVSYILLSPAGSAFAASAPRSEPSGRLDKTFGTGGFVTESWPPSVASDARAVAAQPDGRILLGGTDEDGARILRYGSDGRPDPTLGGDGSVVFGPEPGVEGSVIAMAVRPDGKIVVLGTKDGPDKWSWYRYVARLHPDGSLDTSFGTSGFTTVGLGGPNESLEDLALQADGKIVVGGRRGADQFYLARLNEDGSPDTGFGLGGEIITSFPNAYTASVLSVLIQPDGRIVAVGNMTGDVGIARYEPDGTLDAGFGVGGLVVSSIVRGPAWGGLQPDGSIVVAGGWNDIPSGFTDFAVTRFLPDGTLDTAFGEAGRARIDFGKNTDLLDAGAIQDDGRIVVLGRVTIYEAGATKWAFGLARLDRAGRLDKGFGHRGITILELDDPEPKGIALQPDGKILAAGYAIDLSGNPVWITWLARFHP